MVDQLKDEPWRERLVEMGALATLTRFHHCRLKKAERGIPAGTPCDVCIDDAKWIAKDALAAYDKEHPDA